MFVHADLTKGMNWIYPSIGGAIMAFGLGSIGDIAITVVIDAYKDVRAWWCLEPTHSTDSSFRWWAKLLPVLLSYATPWPL